jgi:HK97 family phage major capsid protein
MVANRAVYQKIRHFTTAGGNSIWDAGTQLQVGVPNNVPQPGNLGTAVLGYPAYEASAMSSAFTTGQLLAVLGDFSRYFIIVDRIGMTVENVPHVFGTTSIYPTGQRGIFAYWRNSSGVASTSAFKVLKLA